MNSRYVIGCLLLFVLVGSASAATKTFDNDGTDNLFSNADNWDGNTAPQAGDDLVIPVNCIFDLNAGTTPPSSTVFGNLTISSSAVLTFTATTPHSLKVLDAQGMSPSGTITLGTGHLDISGTLDLTNLTLNTGSGIVEFSGTDAQTIPAIQYFDLFLTGNRGTNAITLAAGTISVSGAFDISGVSFTGGMLLIVPAPTSIVNYNGSGAQTVAAIQYEGLTINGRTGLVTFPIDIGGPFPTSVNVAGVLTLAGPPTTYSTTGSTIVYNGMASQPVANATGFIYNNLVLANNAGATFAAQTYTIGGDFSAVPQPPATYSTAGSTLNFIPPAGPMQFIDALPFDNLTIAGDRSTGSVQFNPGTYGIAGALTLSATNVTYLIPANNEFDYNGAGAQTIAALPYENLTISGVRVGSPTITLQGGMGPIEIYDSFTITATGVGSYVATGTEVAFLGNTMTQTIPGVIPYNILTLQGSAQKEVGLGSVSCLTLNMMNASVVIQPSLSLSTTAFNANAMSTISFTDNTASFSLAPVTPTTYGGVFSGAGSILKQGTGSLTLTAPNTAYTGGVALMAGALNLNNAQALGAAGTAGNITLSGGMLSFAGFDLPNEVAISGGTPTIEAGGNAGAKITVGSSATVNLQTIGAGDQFSVLLKSPSPSANTTFAGPGRLILLDNPTLATHYDGTFTVSGGAVRLESPTSLGKPASTAMVGTGAFLASNSATPIPQSITLVGGALGVTGVGPRLYSGSVQVSMPSAITLVDPLMPGVTRSFTLAGTLGGTDLDIVSLPPPALPPGSPPPILPMLTLSGNASLYSSTITVTGGAEFAIAPPTNGFGTATINVQDKAILTALSPTCGTPTVNVQAGGLLRGSGAFGSGALLNVTGGMVDPGVGPTPASLSLGMLSADPATLFTFDLNAPAMSSDQINCANGMALDGTVNIRALGPLASSYTLFQTSGSFSDGGLALGAVPVGYDFALVSTASAVMLNVTPQPIVFSGQSAATGTTGENFSYSIVVNGPSALPIMVSVGALPPGLRRSGLSIIGNPTQTGTFPVTLSATNGIATATQNITITVNEPVQSGPLGPFAVEGRVGFPFFLDFADFVEETVGVTFTSTALPDGLKLTGSTISGIPKAAGQTSVTVTGTDAGGSGTVIFNFTILEKTVALGPVLSDLLVDPEEPGLNELILFSVDASHPENLPVTVTWDFGDGTTATGKFVEKTFTAANTYAVTVTGTAGGKTTTLTKAVTVNSIDPNAPAIADFTVSPAPSVVGQQVTFTATTSDPNGDVVSVAWDFGDGQSTATGNTVTFTYTTAGKYSVTAVATDSTGLKSRTLQFLHFVGKGTGESNGQSGITRTSFDGISQKLNFSEDGLIGLMVSETGQTGAFNRADMEADTDFGIPTRRAVKGGTPSAQFASSMLTVAKTTIREKATRKERGKARKTLGISTRETKQPALVEAEPEDKKMNTVKLKGDFFPSRSAGASSGTLSRAVSKDALPSDKVTASGAIMMPAGLDMSSGTEVQVALGNIIDKVVIDAKGKGKGKFTTLQMRIKTDKTTKKTVGNVAAKFSIKMSVAEMVDNGFDTEGVVVSKDQSGSQFDIQCAMLIGGVVYTTDNPVTLKVSPKEDKAQMVTRRATAN